MVTLSSYLIWQIISFVLSPNKYGCVYASLSWPAIDLKKMAILAKKIVFLYETHFHLGGYVNEQNFRIWDTENPHAYIEKPTHPNRFTVWCGFWSRSIFGPFFFENEQGEAVTVNCYRYRVCWTNYCSQKFKRRILATARRYVTHSRSYSQWFAPCFWRSLYQPQAVR